MSVPEESRPKTRDTDQVVNADHSDDQQRPDTRGEMEAELQDKMEQENLNREDFGEGDRGEE
ncbi:MULTISPECIES: hypothetical protein [Nocardiopsis]|uniref:Uncharacterized protein n=1 Tax=Nocardiopsis sinuspersici TaxID=501010 RepID=A0A1V3BYN4_9ACTN|nr:MULTISPECIES: hypothetical protein [Nocardiopsis]OOC53369.1 hypothetical protein NOSIN_05720 [Nocardiopsis sinuspersici]